MGGRGGEGGTMTASQAKLVEKIKSKLKVGSIGTSRFGGQDSKIKESPTFTRNKDGSISYRVVGERILYAEKSVTIGVGDRPERLRTTISTGRIMKDGLIIENKKQFTEVVVNKKRKKR